jgi:hypothetical protein
MLLHLLGSERLDRSSTLVYKEELESNYSPVTTKRTSCRVGLISGWTYLVPSDVNDRDSSRRIRPDTNMLLFLHPRPSYVTLFPFSCCHHGGRRQLSFPGRWILLSCALSESAIVKLRWILLDRSPSFSSSLCTYTFCGEDRGCKADPRGSCNGA